MTRSSAEWFQRSKLRAWKDARNSASGCDVRDDDAASAAGLPLGPAASCAQCGVRTRRGWGGGQAARCVGAWAKQPHTLIGTWRLTGAG